MIRLKKLAQFNTDSKFFHIFLLLLVWLPYFYNSWAYSIWDSNEAYYVEGPKEMLNASDQMSPRFNDTFRFEKPILSYWVVILMYKLFGISVFSERLAINIFVLGSIFLIYALARIVGESETRTTSETSSGVESETHSCIPLLAAIIFATSFKYFTLAHRSIIDILFTFWILLSLYCYMRFIKSQNHSVAAYYGMFISFALGVLTKGLVGLLVPGAIIGIHLIYSRRLYLLKEKKFFIGILVFLLVASPWYIYMALAHGSSYLNFFIIGNPFKLYTKGAYSLARPLWYYIPTILGGFAPWSCFILIIIYSLYHSYRKKDHHADRPGFIIIWIVFIFIFFSLSKGKQEEYVLQIYPALSLLLGWAINYYQNCTPSRLIKILTRITVSLFSIVFLLSGVAMFLLNRIIFSQWDYLYIFPILFVLYSIFAILIFTDSNVKKIVLANALFTWLLYVILIAFYLPLFEKEYKYVKDFADTYKKISVPGDQIGYYKVGIPSLCFYANQKVHIFMNTEEITQVLKNNKLFLIIDQKNFDNLNADFRNNFIPVKTRKQFPTTSRNFMKLTRGYGVEDVVLFVSK